MTKQAMRDDKEDEITGGVFRIANHLYFYADVSGPSCFNFIKFFTEIEKECIIEKEMNETIRPIIIHINSFGGLSPYDFTMVDKIVNAKVPTISIVDGVAASAASVIACVAGERRIIRNGTIMIHAGSVGIEGEVQKILDEKKVIDLELNMLMDVYLNYGRLKMDRKDLQQMLLSHDYYFSAKEALKKGLVDKII